MFHVYRVLSLQPRLRSCPSPHGCTCSSLLSGACFLPLLSVPSSPSDPSSKVLGLCLLWPKFFIESPHFSIALDLNECWSHDEGLCPQAPGLSPYSRTHWYHQDQPDTTEKALLCWQEKDLAGSLAGEWRTEPSKGSWLSLQVCAHSLLVLRDGHNPHLQGWREQP